MHFPGFHIKAVVYYSESPGKIHIFRTTQADQANMMKMVFQAKQGRPGKNKITQGTDMADQKGEQILFLFYLISKIFAVD